MGAQADTQATSDTKVAKGAVADATSMKDATVAYKTKLHEDVYTDREKRFGFGRVHDLNSLVAKYGNERFLETLAAAGEEVKSEVEDLTRRMHGWLADPNVTVVEFEHDRGSRFVMVGVTHSVRKSVHKSLEIVHKEKPECLMIERHVGDDSLQKFTVPDELYQTMKMPKEPSVLEEGDTPEMMINKFLADYRWLSQTPGFGSFGSPAYYCHEGGASLEEWTKLRTEMGGGGARLGGTLCMCDVDLRWLPGGERFDESAGKEMASDQMMAVRDLHMAGAARAVLRTHGSAVLITGQDHIHGITMLLEQDPSIRATWREGEKLTKPCWAEGMKKKGRWFELACRRGDVFSRAIDAQDHWPLATFFPLAAAQELVALRERQAGELRKLGVDAPVVAPRSSEIFRDLVQRGLAAVPRDEGELQQWLDGGKPPITIPPDHKFLQGTGQTAEFFFPFESKGIESIRYRARGL